MAPSTRSRLLVKNAFAPTFSKQKTQLYSDSARSSISHNIRTIAWNPLGTLIATGTGDRTLRIWNPEKANVKNSTELRGHQGSIEQVAWNPVKEAELASCGTDGTLRFWDVRSKASIGEVKVGGECFTLAWTPDGNDLLVGRKDDTLFQVNRPSLTSMSSHRQNVQTNQTLFSYSGRELFLTTGDGQVRILDYPSMSILHTLNAHTSSCYSLDLAPTGSYLGIGGSDALITIWDTHDFICQRTLSGTTGPVRSISFSFDGNYILGGSDDGNGLEIAHVETGDYVYKIEAPYPCPWVQWHPNRYVLAYSGDPAGLKIVGGIGGI